MTDNEFVELQRRWGHGACSSTLGFVCSLNLARLLLSSHFFVTPCCSLQITHHPTPASLPAVPHGGILALHHHTWLQLTFWLLLLNPSTHNCDCHQLLLITLPTLSARPGSVAFSATWPCQLQCLGSSTLANGWLMVDPTSVLWGALASSST